MMSNRQITKTFDLSVLARRSRSYSELDTYVTVVLSGCQHVDRTSMVMPLSAAMSAQREDEDRNCAVELVEKTQYV